MVFLYICLQYIFVVDFWKSILHLSPLQTGIYLDKSPLLHIKLKYDAVFLLVPVPGIGFDYYTAHPLVESHGILIVRTAIAGITADSFFLAVVIQDRKGLLSDPSVLILLQHIQGIQPYPCASMLKNEISDSLVIVFDQIYREGWI